MDTRRLVPDEHMFRTEAYDYHLPRHLIAQEALPERDASRLLVLSRDTGRVEHSRFHCLPRYLGKGDVLVVNNSKVIPARLFGRKQTGGRVELLLVAPCCAGHGRGLAAGQGGGLDEKEWLCLVRSSGSLRPGMVIALEGGIDARLGDKDGEGTWRVRFECQGSLLDHIEKIGHPPLPPYIKRPRPEVGAQRQGDDASRYQTMFACLPGSIAAPTAGLHFTPRLCQRLEESGVRIVEVTLHVGLATFRPIRAGDVRLHTLPPERYSISGEACREIEHALAQDRRVIAVGTTVVRCLESVMSLYGRFEPHTGWATLYVVPGYSFRAVRGMITNFHLPRTSLLVLVSAFAGRDTVLRAYNEAVENGYRFYSYGDAMLIR